MTNQELEKKIADAFEKSTPHVLEYVKNAEIVRLEDTDAIIGARPEKKRNIYRSMQLMAACILLLVTFGIGRAVSFHQTATIVSIDVNPSFELTANKADKVLDVKALNEDARVVLGTMNLKKVDLDVAVNALIGSMVKNGYVSELKNSILITVVNEDETKSQEIKANLLDDLNRTLASSNIDAVVYSQNIAESKKEYGTLQEKCGKHGISAGKLLFIEKLVQKDASLSVEMLAGMSINDIAKLVKERNIDISDMIEVDEEDSLSESIKDGIEEIEEDQEESRETEKGHHNSGMSDGGILNSGGDSVTQKGKEDVAAFGTVRDDDDNDDDDNDDDDNDDDDNDDDDNNDNDEDNDDDKLEEDDDRENEDSDDDDDHDDDDDDEEEHNGKGHGYGHEENDEDED